MRDKFTERPIAKWTLLIGMMLWLGSAHAVPKLSISSAALNKKGVLTVKGSFATATGETMPQDAQLQLLHGEGGVLASKALAANTKKNNKQSFSFAIPSEQLNDKPCAVDVSIDGASISKKVSGAPKDCGLTPICKITVPKLPKGLDAVVIENGKPASFKGSAQLKDKKAAPLKYEWDFSGGAIGQAMENGNGHFYHDGHPNSQEANVTFIRDNSYYRARFSATDAKGHRCEAGLMLKVGEPIAALDSVKAMADASVNAAPLRGNELDGKADDVVVLPFEEWSMNNDGDMKSVRNGYMAWIPLVTSMNAYAYKKGFQPKSLGITELDMRYSAASNPGDPVGKRSINSTSRNYPVTSVNDLLTADIQKTDIWNVALSRDRTPGSAAMTIPEGVLKDANGNPVTYEVNTAAYRNTPWILDRYFTISVPDPVDSAKSTAQNGVAPEFDEGAVRAYLKDGVRTMVNDPNNTDHGRYMPGKAKPYEANDPQEFSGFNPKIWNPNTSRYEDGNDDWWKANQVPITGIDDQGRDNIYNLLRVEAVDKATGNTVAKTDGVLSSGRDFHCRECHAKGGIAAPENPPHTKAACRASAYGANADLRRSTLKRAAYPVCDEKPRFFSVADIGGIPGNLLDEEYVASINANGLHEFYDGFYLLGFMQYGAINSTSGKVIADRPMNCMYCHNDINQSDNFGLKWDGHGARNNINDAAFLPDYSVSMHRFHGELMWNTDKNGIQRDDKGMFKRFDWRSGDKQRTANANLNPDTLFPIFKDGKQLPMEENCLKCHGGKREQHYRDRMYTAGISCYDCHGDMLAMGGAFTKTDGRPGVKDPASATDTSGEKHDLFRVPWYDQPDCGACHSGKGKDPVLKTAFNPLQPAQVSFKPDLTDPDQARFAVIPRVVKEVPMTAYGPYNYEKQSYPTFTEPVKIDAALFRKGKDTHGNVACGACHGAAHAIWPNRDPKANDNVTALQLQGHTGTILECNVCHTADSFKKDTDLDGGLYSGDPKEGILGGPHNMHPVNDPYWWSNSEGSSGGWHNDYAKKTGKNGEDQCAACHGADHKGTRLSKTPVERVFVNPKLPGVKPKVVVPAGTPISCDMCHSLGKSIVLNKQQAAVANLGVQGSNQPNNPIVSDTDTGGVNTGM